MTNADRVELRRYEGVANSHCHPFLQVVLPSAGRLDMEIEGAGGRVAEGCCAIIPPGFRHGFSGNTGCACVVADLGEPMLATAAGAGLLDGSAPRFIPVGERLYNLCAYLCAGTAPVLDGIRATVVGEMIVGGLMESVPNTTPGPDPWLARATAYIHRRFADPITIADIALAAATSESRLRRRFRSGLGISPGEYLGRYRVNFSAHLLESTDLPVSRVATASGYQDHSAFSRAFTKARGISPSRYRQKHRAGTE